MKVSLNLDSDGFLSQECPECSGRFKVRYEEGGNVLGCCPYCGHRGTGCWWTQEQADYLSAMIANETADELGKSLKSLNKPGSAIQFTGKATPGEVPPIPHEPDDPMPRFCFGCCGEDIKYRSGETQMNCVICGAKVSVE